MSAAVIPLRDSGAVLLTFRYKLALCRLPLKRKYGCITKFPRNSLTLGSIRTEDRERRQELSVGFVYGSFHILSLKGE